MPNQIIRQEINLLDAVLSAAGGATATSNEIIQLDTTQYTSPTYYFEVVADSTISITFTVTLRRSGTSTDDATCTIPLLSTSFKRIRSASFTPPAGQTNYVVQVDATAGATKNVNAARIVIIQNAGAIVNSETQIEIGNNEAAKTNTAIAALTNPKYWLFTAANWGGTMTCYAEVVSKTSAANTHTVRLEEDDGAFANWTTKITIVNAVSGTTVTRRRSTSFVPTTGRHYRISALCSTTKSSYTIYCAKIIIDCSSCTNLELQYLLLNTGDSGTGQQFMQTLWDATEWNDTIGGLPSFKYSHDASNASDSSKLIDIDNGNADVTGATVTGTNQQISAAFTMPTTGHQVDVNVTNSTGVVAATRVLAIYSKVFDLSTMAMFRNIEQPYFGRTLVSESGMKSGAVIALGYDPAAQAFITAAGITDDTQKTAINNLVIAAKANGWWTLCSAIYPFVGGSNTAHSYNLKNTALYQLTYTGTPTSNATGINFNAGTSSADTNLNTSTVLSVGSCHLSLYSQNNINEGGDDIGTSDGTYFLAYRIKGTFGTGLVSIADQFSGGDGWGITPTSTQGFLVCNIPAVGIEGYRNGSLYGSDNTPIQVNLPNSNVILNKDGACTKTLSFCTIGASFTSLQAANMYTDVQAFQTALGR